MKHRKANLTFHAMMVPGMAFILLFHIIPMAGLVMAFQNFLPAKGLTGSKWVGLDNFKFMFMLPDSRQIFVNTLVIAVSKMILNLLVPLIFALMLNAVRSRLLKRTLQTIVYLPNFISWVILGSIIADIFSKSGIINVLLSWIGIEPIIFMGSNKWFRPIVVLSDVWKGFGYNSIIFLAALAGIDPTLYEASSIDGATKWKQLWHITLPSIISTVVLVGTLSLGNVLNAGFDQIFNLYNPLVYRTGDIIDTYVYRMGLENAQFSLATAVGMMKSVISFILIIISYKLAEKFANYRIF
ncbi:MAG: ABC transporter permease subunit [Lachnospiraceae bacterium]|jgi:putative aldouronate transport system permease protein|nr:ABC transporter permease subunit [Lachnospiraceae bacterium]